MNKIPLELVTTLSNAPTGSPVIWNGDALVVSQKTEYNLDTLVRIITGATQRFDEYVSTYTSNLQQIPQLVSQINELKPVIDSAQRLSNQISSELGQINTNVNAFASKLSPLDVRVSILSNSVTAFRSSAQETLGAVANIDARVKSLESAGGLTTRMAMIESQYSEIDRRINPLEAISTSTQVDLISLTARMTTLEGRVLMIESNIQSLMAQK